MGFSVVNDRYFHLLLIPRPLDKLAPKLASTMGRWLERGVGTSPLRYLAEGYVALARKPVEP